MKKALKKITDIISTVMVVCILLCTLMLAGARLAGLKVYTVVSGSMQPTYNVGDLIYVKKVDPAAVKVGDPITFVLNESLVVATHRVVEIDAEGQHFYTKGDNNQVADINPVHFNNLIGKPVFAIPYLGYVSDWVKAPPGLYITLAVAAVLIAIVYIPDLFIKDKREISEKETEVKK